MNKDKDQFPNRIPSVSEIWKVTPKGIPSIKEILDSDKEKD
jgi:hypothetical protein